MTLRERFLAFDDRLASLGVPRLTDWWRDGIGEWLDAYERGHVLEFWACVGRGAAKSTALYKLALFFALFGRFEIPIAERHFAVVLSRLKEEAEKGIAIIAAWLRLLEIPHTLAGDVIELGGEWESRGIRVVAKSVAATSGWRAFFVGKDERSKWPAGGAEEVDAQEIDTSASAMTATHAYAPIVSVGSAWGQFGAFYEAITSGTDDTKHVLGPAPTWVAAPHVREEDTRRKERDPKKWAREYACVFQGGGIGALDPDEVRACIRELHPNAQYLHGEEIVIDSSGGKGDNFVLARFAWVLEPTIEAQCDEHGNQLPIRGPLPQPEPRLWLAEMVTFEGAIARSMSTHDVGDEIARMARRGGARRVHGDQYGAWSWSSDLRKHGLAFEEHAWSAPTKTDAVLRARQLLRERRLVIDPSLGPQTDALVSEARTFEEKIMPSGVISFGARGRAKDDRVMTLLLAARADAEGRLQGSPLRRSGQRHEVYDFNDPDDDDDADGPQFVAFGNYDRAGGY